MGVYDGDGAGLGVGVVLSGVVDFGGGGGGGGVGFGGGVVLVKEVPEDEPPAVFEKEEVPKDDGAGLAEEPEVPLEVEEGLDAVLAAVLDATLRVGIPRSILLHPTKASDATVPAVGRLSGERYLHPAKARGPMLVSFPST